MAGIQIKNVKFSKNGKEYLHNINLKLEYGKNIVIIPDTEEDYKSAQYLVRTIAGTIKPTSGLVEFDSFHDNRILFGYKNFEGIFKKGVSVNELIKTLMKTQKLSEANVTEIKEIGELLRIDSFVNNKTTALTADQLNILNLYTLLIVKPHCILLDNLVLPGSEKLHLAILNFITDYCKSYDMSIIVVSNDKNVFDELADRTITLSSTRVIADSKINKISESEHLNVDNKTKAFDLEDDILAVLNEKTPTSHLGFDEEDEPKKTMKDVFVEPKKPLADKIKPLSTNKYEPTSNNKYDVEKDLVKTITKALDLDFDLDDLNVIEQDDDETKITSHLYEDEIDDVQKTMTDELFTNKYEVDYEDNEEEIVTESFAPTNKSKSLNERITGSFDYNSEEIHNKTKKLNEDSKDILQDINMSFGQETPKTKTLRLEDEDESDDKTTLLTNNFLADLKETYIIRRQLSEKIKSPEFNQLTPELQLRVYENYECADKLIKETDPNGDYDPFRIKTREVSNDTAKIPTMPINQRGTVTQKLIEEVMIDEEDEEDDFDDTTTAIMNTSSFETEELDSENNNTIGDVIDEVTISNAFDDDFEDEEDSGVPKTSAYKYLDTEKKAKHGSWRERFAKKEPNKSISEKMYGPTKELDDDTSNLEEEQEEIITSKLETDEIESFTKDLNDHFEPTSKLATAIAGSQTRKTRSFFDDETEELSTPTRRTTSVVLPTREYKTQSLSEEQTRKLKTMAIKQRSKKNLIEKLYDEALDDFKIIDDIKGKKGK